MAFTQTPKGHKSGDRSYHQIGLMHAQFDMSPEGFMILSQKLGFDVSEIAAWSCDLDRCNNDEEAAEYASALVSAARSVNKNHEIAVLATHILGQVLGDEVSAKTLQFLPGECDAVKAYGKWRAEGNSPPVYDPYFVPRHVADMAHEEALRLMLNSVRLAHQLSIKQEREVPISTFTGSPANRFANFFEFPPPATKIAGYDIPNIHACSAGLLVERHGPILDLCKTKNVKHGLEAHPSEFAIGDLHSAARYLSIMDDVGYSDVAGFNYDPSHMVWQGVDPVRFIELFGERIWSAHMKGVQVTQSSAAGILGGHEPMNHPNAGWQFVTVGCERDCVPLENVVNALTRSGWDGALIVEHEDSEWLDQEGAKLALDNVRRVDRKRPTKRHDEAFAQK